MKIGVKMGWGLLSHQACLQKPHLRLRFRMIVTIFANTWITQPIHVEAFEILSPAVNETILLPTHLIQSNGDLTWPMQEFDQVSSSEFNDTKPTLQNKELRKCWTCMMRHVMDRSCGSFVTVVKRLSFSTLACFHCANATVSLSLTHSPKFTKVLAALINWQVRDSTVSSHGWPPGKYGWTTDRSRTWWGLA